MLSAKSSPNFLHTHHISSTEPGESKLEPHPTYTGSLSANASSVDLVREKAVKVDKCVNCYLKFLMFILNDVLLKIPLLTPSYTLLAKSNKYWTIVLGTCSFINVQAPGFLLWNVQILFSLGL